MPAAASPTASTSAKTPVAPAMVGRADPDVIRSQYYPTTRNVLLQKGGVSSTVQTFVDDKLNALLEAIAAATDRCQAHGPGGRGAELM